MGEQTVDIIDQLKCAPTLKFVILLLCISEWKLSHSHYESQLIGSQSNVVEAQKTFDLPESHQPQSSGKWQSIGFVV